MVRRSLITGYFEFADPLFQTPKDTYKKVKSITLKLRKIAQIQTDLKTSMRKYLNRRKGKKRFQWLYSLI